MMREMPEFDPMQFVFLSKHRIRKKRMRNKFKNKPQKYLPVWVYGLWAGEVTGRYLRAKAREDSFANRIMPPTTVEKIG